MKLVCSDIFEQFHCIGSQCKDNCCRIGWDIEIDSDTYNFYKSLDDDMGRKIAANIYEEDGCHYMKQDGGCPFLNEKGLCSVLLKYGEDRISEICAQHPRFYEWFGNYKEAGVGLCCEETCRLIMEHCEPLEFFEKEIEETEDDLEYDEGMFRCTLKLRNKMISLLQNRKIGFSKRINILVCLSGEIQNAFDCEDKEMLNEISDLTENDFSEILSQAEKMWAEQGSEEICGIYRGIIDYFKNLDYIHSDFTEMLSYAEKNLDGILENEKNYEEKCSAGNYVYEHICVYFIYRYFLKAVRDYDGASKILFAAVSVIVIRLLEMAEFYKNGVLTQQDRILIIKEYSKEVEYSADNAENIREDLYTDSRLSAGKISAVLTKII